MSAGRVRQGGVFVEIGADARKFFATLDRVNKQIGKVGASLAGIGGRMAGLGAGMAAPFIASAVAGARFQDVLLNVQASTGATAAELDAVRKAAMAMSQSLGVGPTEAAAGFLELLKAGMSVEQVLGGAGEAAIAFAKVGQMAVADAAVVMADAMNVFKVTGDVAANTLSAAADASSTSIEGIAQAFSQVSAVAGLANQSIQDTAASLAVLANAGIKGSDAGTSLKTMLMRLIAPAEDAVGALEQVGLSVSSFRNADGTMKPMVEIIRTLSTALEGMDQAAKDDIFRRIFGQDAIRAAAVMTAAGVDGFNAMRDSMGGAMSVGDKFATMNSGLSGAVATLRASLERLAIAVSDAVGPALMNLAGVVGPVIDGFAKFVNANQELVGQIAKAVVATIAIGGAFVVFGTSLRLASFGLSGITQSLKLAIAPLSMMTRVALLTGNAFSSVFGQVGGAAVSGVSAVFKFASSSGVALARASAGFGGLAVSAATSAASVSASMTGTALVGVMRFVQMGLAGLAQYSAKSTALMAVSAGRVGAMGAAQVAATVSVISATVARAAEGNMRAAAIGVQALGRLGIAGTTNALIAGAQVARLSAEGSTQLLRLGVAGSTSLATIGTTAISTGGSATAALARASAGISGALAKASTVSIGGLARIATGATATGTATLAAFAKAAAGAVASAGVMTATWLGGMARVTATAAISGVAMAASFLAPFALIGVAIAGAVALVVAFKDQIFAALAPVGQLVGQAASAIGAGFSTAISDAITVFGDLASTATTTFNGIYAAVAEGDLSGAMDILWAGLYAGWLRGVEALMGAVDPWVSMFQSTFTYLGTTIATTWEAMWSGLSQGANTIGAVVMGVVDNLVNGVMAAFDKMVAAVRKSWNWVQSFIVKGYDLAKENEKVDSEMAARARKREQDRPGVQGRLERAGEQNAQTAREAQSRIDAINRNADETAAGREEENRRRADQRRAETQAAEQNVAAKSKAATSTRTNNAQFADLLKNIEAASSISQLQDLYGEFDALSANGRLTSAQQATIEAALEDAQERVSRASSQMGGSANRVDPQAVGNAASGATQNQSEVAGTFSAMAAAAMGFGQSLAQKQLDTLKSIEQNTRPTEGAVVGA